MHRGLAMLGAIDVSSWSLAIICLLIGIAAAWRLLCPPEAPSGPKPWPVDPPGSSQSQPGVRLVQTNPSQTEELTDIDIIAVHGLDTTSPQTWTWTSQRMPGARPLAREDPKDIDTDWLRDTRMLPSVVGRARIFTCDWPADLFQPCNAFQKTLDEHALLLLSGIEIDLLQSRNNTKARRPLLFIASCLGGIILMKALVMANRPTSVYRKTREATGGVIFLATPFRGTAFNDVAFWAELGLQAWGLIRGRQPNVLLDSVKGPKFDGLVQEFTQLCRDQSNPCDVFTFYELGYTSLPSKVFPWMPKRLRRDKTLVDRTSATLDMVLEPLPLNRPHVLMNKFEGPQCPDYRNVAAKVTHLLQKIHDGDPLTRADRWIREHQYTAKNLQIERLSGDGLPMDSCYINLALVERDDGTKHRAQADAGNKDEASRSSPFSLPARLRVETPSRTIQVDPKALFDPRERNGHIITPRRILIRGRAGVGKTTLCKKFVHDFTRRAMWTNRFDRVLWIPLRRLKSYSATHYTLDELFRYEFFLQQGENSARSAQSLLAAIEDGRTLFILDGLDEVLGLLDFRCPMCDVLTRLLNSPDAIITARPHIRFPVALAPPNLELETIGLYPDQVHTYLQMAFPHAPLTVQDITGYLDSHRLMQDLARIPIQLDAFCFIWDTRMGQETPLESMTTIYQAIATKLWAKDILRLEKTYQNKPVTELMLDELDLSDLEGLVTHEVDFLEELAFQGLHSDVIEFQWDLLRQCARATPQSSLFLKEHLPHLSFLRASTSIAGVRSSYHFLHLTYQEYFAARFFVRRWQREPLAALLPNPHRNEGDRARTPVQYLEAHKYNPAYDLLWRFVAGLLHEHGRAKEFFKELEKEPRDLIGPSHQRLVIHCLSEVTQSDSNDASASDLTAVRARLEDHLKNWLLFECQSRYTCSLAREVELSQQILLRAFEQAEDEDRIVLMGSMKSQTSPLISELLDQIASQLKVDDEDVQVAALQALQGRHSLPEHVLEQFGALMDNDSDQVVAAAIEALFAQPLLPPQVLQCIEQQLDNKGHILHAALIEALGSWPGLTDTLLMRVVEQLDGGTDSSSAVISAIAAQESLSQPVREQIIARFNDGEWSIRAAAIEALSTRRAPLHAELERIVLLIEDDEVGVRVAVARVLAEHLDLSGEGINHIQKLLGDIEKEVRRITAKVLTLRRNLPQPVLQRVAELLHDEDRSVQRFATRALRAQLTLSTPVLDWIEQQAQTGNPFVQREALHVLKSLTLSRASLAKVVAVLGDSQEVTVQCEAIRVLGSQMTLSDHLIAVLEARLERGHDVEVRCAAAEVLGLLPASSPAQLAQIQALLQALLDDHHIDLLRKVIQTLGQHRTLSQAIVDMIAAQLDSPHRELVHAALAALENQDILSDVRVEQVAMQLSHNDPPVREAAVKVLGSRRLSPGRLMQILGLLHDDDHDLQRIAVEVVGSQAALSQTPIENFVETLSHSPQFVLEAALRSLFEFRGSLPVVILPGSAEDRKALYEVLLYSSWKGDVCWPTAGETSSLQFGQAAPIAWDSWDLGLTDDFREIQKELGVPQPISLDEVLDGAPDDVSNGMPLADIASTHGQGN